MPFILILTIALLAGCNLDNNYVIPPIVEDKPVSGLLSFQLAGFNDVNDDLSFHHYIEDHLDGYQYQLNVSSQMSSTITTLGNIYESAYFEVWGSSQFSFYNQGYWQRFDEVESQVLNGTSKAFTWNFEYETPSSQNDMNDSGDYLGTLKNRSVAYVEWGVEVSEPSLESADIAATPTLDWIEFSFDDCDARIQGFDDYHEDADDFYDKPNQYSYIYFHATGTKTDGFDANCNIVLSFSLNGQSYDGYRLPKRLSVGLLNKILFKSVDGVLTIKHTVQDDWGEEIEHEIIL